MFKKIGILLMLLAPSVQLFAHGISESDKAAMLSGGYLEYIRLGAVHMLTGYDHLLFLFCVIFFLTNFKDILKFITAFTVGHSITLIFATVFGISANYYLVDAVIALSVIYKGFENIDGFKQYLKVKSPNLMMVVFLFGLVHGFGLSTRLQQLPLGDSGLIMRILSFNVGVEVGQIVALAVMVLLISNWRKSESFAKFSKASNVALMIGGLLLFTMQMHGYLHTKNPDEFGFSKDNHFHAHQKIKMMQKPVMKDDPMPRHFHQQEKVEKKKPVHRPAPKRHSHSHGSGSHTH